MLPCSIVEMDNLGQAKLVLFLKLSNRKSIFKTFDSMQSVKKRGMRETVHVLVCTYTEPAATVRECVLRLLVAPEPIYMEKMIYVCDDGHAKSEGPKKKAIVEELRILGTHIHYIHFKYSDVAQGPSDKDMYYNFFSFHLRLGTTTERWLLT